VKRRHARRDIGVWIAVLLALVACAGPARAADAGRAIDLDDLAAPAFTTFSVRDGVPDAVIGDVRPDTEGFVWLAAANGLARYDGHVWNAIDAPAVAGTLGTFTLGHDGVLWVAFRDRGVARFDGTAWHFEGRAHGLPDNVRRIVEIEDAADHHQLFAATFGAGLLQRDGERWTPAPGTEELPADVVAAARTQRLGGGERLWAGTLRDGLWYRADGHWRRFRDARFDPGQIEDLRVVARGDDEQLWILAFGDGLWRLDRDGLRQWSARGGELPSNDLYQIEPGHAANGDTVLWIASRGGLLRVHGDRVQTFDRRHGLPANAVRGVSLWRSPDGIEVLWAATEAGVARAVLGATQWRTVSLLGSGGTGIWNILPETDQRGAAQLWIAAAADGLGLYRDGVWQRYAQRNAALPANDARLIERTRDRAGTNTLWLGLWGGELLRVAPGPRFVGVVTPWRKRPSEVVMDTLARVGGARAEQWFALREAGVYRLRDGAWTAYLADGVTAPWSVVQLVEQIDAHGRSWLWASSKQGLARYDDRRWERIKLLPDDHLFGVTLLPDARGRPILWIGSRNRGVQRVDVSDPADPRLLPDDLPPAPDPTAYSALRDSRGRVFICTNNGVQLLTPTAQGYAARVYTHRDGLVHDECNTNAQFLDAQDRYWAGTLGGVSVFDPASGIRDTTSKPLKRTNLRLDGQPVSAQDLRIPPGRHELRVDFALLSWNRESETTFRTQLVGLDAEPDAWSARNFRVLGALPPGSYRLRIEGRDYAGNESLPLELPFEVLAAWWQRPLALAGFALFAALVAHVMVRWRTRRLLSVQRRLETIVQHNTRDLREANARLRELSYSDALTGLANRRRLLEALEARLAEAGADAWIALIFLDVDHFKSFNDRHGHPAGDEALRAVAAAMRAVAPPLAIAARYGGEEFACLLPDALAAEAMALAERIRARVEAGAVAIAGTPQTERITVSAGVAARRIAVARDVHELLREADRALYRAKHDGRNCVRGAADGGA
jgi:diguanylate cyclase (GGDEF)-like protein